MRCPNGHDVAAGWKFCGECGLPVGEPGASTPPAQVEPPPPPPVPVFAPAAPSSPSGGDPPSPPAIWKRWWLWVLIVFPIVVGAALAGAGSEEDGATPSSAAAPTSTAPSPTVDEDPCVANPNLQVCQEDLAEEPDDSSGDGGDSGGNGGSGSGGSGEPVDVERVGDGAWVVPQDMEPGLYRAADPGGNCYWERVKNFGGGLNSIIANGLSIGGPIVIEIKRTDAGFQSDGCGTWTTNMSRVSASRTSMGDGIWVVKTDIAPGTYRSTVRGGNCYWARLRSFDGGLNSIAANGLPPRGGAVVQISSSDVGFETHGCGTWKRA